MRDFTGVRLGALIGHHDAVVRRCAVSIHRRLEKTVRPCDNCGGVSCPKDYCIENIPF